MEGVGEAEITYNMTIVTARNY